MSRSPISPTGFCPDPRLAGLIVVLAGWRRLARAVAGALVMVASLFLTPLAADGKAPLDAAIAIPAEGLDIAGKLRIFEDPSGTMTFDEVREAYAQGAFAAPSGKLPRIGFSRSAWWGQFTLANTRGRHMRQIIEFRHPVIDRLEFYRPAHGGGYELQVTGDSVVGRNTDILSIHNVFVVGVPAHASQDYFFRISGKSSLVMDPVLHSARSYKASHGPAEYFYLFIIGTLFAAIFYSLAFYLMLRDELYLMFALFVFGAVGFNAENRGYLAAFVWPETSWLSNLVIIATLCLIVFAGARFTSRFLRLAENAPRADKCLRVIQVTSGLGFLLSFVDYHLASYLVMANFMVGIAVFTLVSLWLWRSGVDYARLYSVAWLLFCGLAAAGMLERLGAIRASHLVDLSLIAIFALISLFFALVFTDRFRRLNNAATRELQTARDEAVAASMAKSKFLATMSHELRTPLNAVIGFSEILMAETLGPLGNPKYREYAADIRESGMHLLRVINDLLHISRVEAGQTELDEQEIAVAELAHRCLRLVEERAREDGIALRAELDEPLPGLVGDETRIQQVLLNLLFNAVKFTPRGGTITLEAGLSPDGEYRLAVTDTGIGIAEEDRERILEPFIQIQPHLTRQQGGVGLGLAIAKAIIDLHGGRLVIKSALGVGTTFAVYFPRTRVVPDAVTP